MALLEGWALSSLCAQRPRLLDDGSMLRVQKLVMLSFARCEASVWLQLPMAFTRRYIRDICLVHMWAHGHNPSVRDSFNLKAFTYVPTCCFVSLGGSVLCKE